MSKPKYKVGDKLIVDNPRDTPIAQRREGMTGCVGDINKEVTAPFFEVMYYIELTDDMDHWFYESEVSMVELPTIITNTEALRVGK